MFLIKTSIIIFENDYIYKKTRDNIVVILHYFTSFLVILIYVNCKFNIIKLKKKISIKISSE